mmetsp:Transcript_9275/g.29473  ORF Transcript_9275/g.29473 Transcript_9275/m.29473 type:complete len:192 (-) Transcript_9275:1488-2063(-)
MLMIGDSAVGKSSLLLRFAEEEFTSEHICTIGVDFKIKTIDLDGKIAKLQIWDTAGQERFRTITNSYYHGAQGIIVVFDLSNRDSFDNVTMWLGEVQRHAPKSVRVLLCGNKSDLVAGRVVTRTEALAFAKSCGIGYVETSAKTDHNVYDAFKSMAEALYKQSQILEAEKKKIKLNSKRIDRVDEPARGCC